MNTVDKESTTEKAIELLNGLTKLTIDGKELYHTAAEDIQRPELKDYFYERSKQCDKAVAAMQEAVRAMGGDPEKSSSVGARLHRILLEFRNAITYGKGSDLSVLAEVVRSERYVLDVFENKREERSQGLEVDEHGRTAVHWLDRCLEGVRKNLAEAESLYAKVKADTEKSKAASTK